MVAPAISVVGLAVCLGSAALLWLVLQLRAARAGDTAHDPWTPTWSASIGNGSDGSTDPARLCPRPNPLTIRDIEARRSQILRWLRRFGVPDSEAPDLVQRVMTEAWLCRERYQPDRADLNGWLRSIARNLASNLLQTVWMQRVDLEDMATHRVWRGTPESAYERAELVHRARAILARIPARLAEIWTRYELEGEAARDIAKETGIPLSTIWGRLQQARALITREAQRAEAVAMAKLRASRAARARQGETRGGGASPTKL